MPFCNEAPPCVLHQANPTIPTPKTLAPCAGFTERLFLPAVVLCLLGVAGGRPPFIVRTELVAVILVLSAKKIRTTGRAQRVPFSLRALRRNTSAKGQRRED